MIKCDNELILATEKVYVFSIMHKGRTTKDLRKNFHADLNFILCHPTMSEHKELSNRLLY